MSNDYSAFSYTDAKGVHVENTYKDLVFHGIDTIDNYPTIAAPAGSSKRSAKMLDAEKEEIRSEPVSRLSISAYENCTITNDQGKELKYDDEQYSATMKVYEEEDIISENPTIEFKVDKSSSFTVSDMDKDVLYQVSTDIGGDYYGIQARGADKIVIKESEIIIEGETYDYSLMQGKEDNEFDYVRVAGYANGPVKSTLTNEYIMTMDAASDSTSVIVSANGEEQEVSINDYVDKITIDKSDDGISIDTNVVKPAEPDDPSEPVHQHTFTPWTVTTAATETSTGVQTRRCPVCGYTETQKIAPLAPSLPAVKITKPAAGKKKITVKWKKISSKNLKKIARIQIEVATDKNFKNIVKSTTAGKKKTSKVIKGLKSKTKYYVRIRAYKSSGGQEHVSKWSSKPVKVK